MSTMVISGGQMSWRGGGVQISLPMAAGTSDGNTKLRSANNSVCARLLACARAFRMLKVRRIE